MSFVYSNGPPAERKDNPNYTTGSNPNKNTSLFTDHAYASNRSDKTTVELLTKEIQSLKQILTLHLNLIEQQSKKIECKDQKLVSLREEIEIVSKNNHMFTFHFLLKILGSTIQSHL